MCATVIPLLYEFGKEMKVGNDLYFILMSLVVVGMVQLMMMVVVRGRGADV